MDRQIKEHWHLFHYLEKDSNKKVLINCANEILDNQKYKNHYFIKNFYSVFFARSLLRMTANEAVTVIFSIKSEQLVSSVITIITEIADFVYNNKLFLNKSNKFCLKKSFKFKLFF